MKKFKKITVALMCLCLAVSLVPMALADNAETSGTCGDNLTWTLSDGVLTISGTGEMEDYSFNPPWESESGSITTVVIENGVTSIGEAAFWLCYNITSVTMPDSVTAIDDYAFFGCSALAGITIPAGVTSIGFDAFSCTYSLTEIVVSEDNQTYCTDNGILYSKDKTELVYYPRGFDAEAFTVPAFVTTIGEGAFDFTGLRNITVSNGVTTIGYCAFSDCSNLRSITLPSSITSIETQAFYSCSGLTDVYYDGSENDWNTIEIGEDNECLTSATIHYNSTSDGADDTGNTPVFTDVVSGSYYCDAVAWAVGQGITTGTTSTTFSPDDTCTRGQIITFLWRAVGSPAPTGAGSFSDVDASIYYADAAQWASEQGIDLSTGTFSPAAACTRATVVEYLYRLAGSPEAAAATQFTDVSASDSYASAVAWAVETGVTTGTSETTFDPAATCTRGQIVTFLYRALG
ncbi:MAG: leucine-rich repeat protein [Oscillospiraceae bacterium]|nr:leucine-rich repeat protein [Oscillospiraceae bacterium]